MTQQQLANRAGVSEAMVRKVETGRTSSPYKLRDILRALGLQSDEPSRLLDASDDELIKELRRRHGWRAADFVRGYLEAERKSETDRSGSRSDNDSLSDKDGS
jgi:transcriptional regulator with XRE-family HTH domain